MLPEKTPQILVVDDEPNLRRVLAAQLARDGYDVHTAENGAEALQVLREHHLDLVITDLRMPELDGMQLLEQALQIEADLPVVMITAHGTVDTAVQALKMGAFDYITKPFDQAEVRAIARKALGTRRESAPTGFQSPKLAPGFSGASSSVAALSARVAEVARSNAPVLVLGEVGTGKEIVARAIHDASARRDRPFIKVNCAALTEDAVASELFGTVPATGTAKPGRLELAAGGVVFIDEVTTMPQQAQELLAMAVQNGYFERRGGVGAIPVEARIMAASRNGIQHASAGLSEPLAQLLLGAVVVVPPLRERAADIGALCTELVARFNARFGKQVTTVSEDALTSLQAYSWPGNVRELESAIEQGVLLCDGDVIQLADLPPEVVGGDESEESGAESKGLKEQVKAITSRVERQLIQQALQHTAGNVTHAARLLKISRKGLQLKMKELGLRERDE